MSWNVFLLISPMHSVSTEDSDRQIEYGMKGTGQGAGETQHITPPPVFVFLNGVLHLHSRWNCDCFCNSLINYINYMQLLLCSNMWLVVCINTKLPVFGISLKSQNRQQIIEQSRGRHTNWTEKFLLERERLQIYLYHQPRGLNI